MFTKVKSIGTHHLGDDTQINGVKIMQANWIEARGMIFPFGALFDPVFYVRQGEVCVFFAAKECGLIAYEIFVFSQKANAKLQKRLKKEKQQ